MLQFSRNALRLSPLGLLVLAACKSNDENITTPSNSNFAKADGTVTKGLLENALVFLDYNKDGIKDADEPSTRTDAKGSYTLVPTKEDFNIVVTTDDTTKDASSGAQAPGLTLSAPKGSKIVSPMTSLLKDGGLSAAEVSKALGLDEDTISLPSIHLPKVSTPSRRWRWKSLPPKWLPWSIAMPKFCRN